MNVQIISSRFVLMLCLFSFALFQFQCKKTNNQKRFVLPKYRPNQLMVWRKPGVNDANWNIRKTSFKNKYGGDFAVTKKCTGCDDALEVWEGTTVQNFITGEVARAATAPKGSPSGEDDTLYYSLNFIVELPIEKRPDQYSPVILPPQTRSNFPVITLAVFDTGVDPDITTNNTTAVGTCKPGGDKGWNFVAENNSIADDFPVKHGTIVSKYILDEVKANRSGNNVNILPVKIFGADGTSDLFGVLCGFAYARNAKAQIINASFGFYYYIDEPPAILMKYTETVLTANNIILIAAAGNRIAEEDTEAGKLGIAGADLRNLDRHYFYPGGLSKYLPNVFCVTTANKTTGAVSPTQNFSNTRVDVGTSPAAGVGYEFVHPFVPAQSISGSSFATPIFAGKLCSWYSQVVTAPINKEAILIGMKAKASVFDDVPALNALIKNGRYVTR
jgi:Subtilase family